MVDILGVGVIIRGESGIGKSESVLALIERGYSLVSDDITKVMLLDGREVMGTSSEITRNHMEVRGIGIINVAAMFGVKSVRLEKRVDLVVSLKAWNEVPDVDRLGMEEQYVAILGVDIPHIIIPVPSRSRPRASDRSCRVPNQAQKLRPQPGQGTERPPHRPNGEDKEALIFDSRSVMESRVSGLWRFDFGDHSECFSHVQFIRAWRQRFSFGFPCSPRLFFPTDVGGTQNRRGA
jgi:hypothetical protein